MARALRSLAAGVALTAAAASFAQVPDVVAHVDLRITYYVQPGGDGRLQAWDSLGRLSTVGLQFFLEPGLEAFFSQRFDVPSGSSDTSQVDEMYVEDAGYWRFGKQALPFGNGAILDDRAMGVRLHTKFSGAGIPLVVAGCDELPGRQEGLIGRLGSKVGFSFALGRHFGIDVGSLAILRLPTEFKSRGEGYRQALGGDYAAKLGIWRIELEAAWFDRGHTAADPDLVVTDLRARLSPNVAKSFELAWSRDWKDGSDFYSASGQFQVAPATWIEPRVRMKGGRTLDFALTVHVRL